MKDVICMSQSIRITAKFTHRNGVTILEVLFAIGIVVVGLLGVAAIVPLANRNAIESYVLTQSVTMGENAYRETQVRQYNSPSVTSPWLKLEDSSSTWTRIPPVTLDKTLGYCVDPLFWSRQQRLSPASEGAYRRSQFPYYDDAYDALSNPTSTPTGSTVHPRMTRVSLPNLLPDGTFSSTPMTANLAMRRFASLDDLVNPRDVNAPSNSIRDFYQLNGNFAQAATNSDFSWMLTLSPNEQLQDSEQAYYTMSMVVFHRRNMSFPAPGVGTDLLDPENLPTDERVCLAMPEAVSTVLTTPGIFNIDLECNENIDSSLRSNSWLMLSRVQVVGAVTKHIHRWYRVVSTTEAAFESSQWDNSLRVWKRKVQLSGPSWLFDSSSYPSSYPTTATLVKGVSSVYERVIPMARDN